jgi:tetratricopeptide (TPR) repeat protein
MEEPDTRTTDAVDQDRHRPLRGRPALANFDLLIAIAPKDADALYGRGEALRALSRHADALAAYQQALAIAPSHAGALGGAAFAALNACGWASAQRLTADILPRVETGMVVSPFVLLNLTDQARLHAIGTKNYVRDQVAVPPARAGLAPGQD